MASSKEKTGTGAERDGTAFLIAQRERERLIKLHDKERKAPKSKADAVILTGAGLPDMRFAEDRVFMKDPSKTVDGKVDTRFIENRPDLLELHRRRGDTRPNMIFTDDMLPDLG